MRKDRLNMGASPHMSNLRWDPVLRLITKSARQQACSRLNSSGYRISGTRRALALLFSRWCLFRIL